MDQWRLAKASFAGICPNSSLKVVYYGSRRSIWADFVEILGGLVISNSHNVKPNPNIKSYGHLNMHTDKVPSLDRGLDCYLSHKGV